MRNAKQEFLEEVNNKVVKCAYIKTDESEYILPLNYSEDKYHDFLNTINFNYDSGYGSQEMQGNIWYEDGTWSDRGEYDGLEWWKYQACPTINKKCKTK